MSFWKALQEMLVKWEADVVYQEDCIKFKRFIKINKETVHNSEKTAEEERNWTEWICEEDEEDEEDEDCCKDDERDRVNSARMMQVCFDWRVRLRTLESRFCNDRCFFVYVSLVNNGSNLHKMYTTR